MSYFTFIILIAIFFGGIGIVSREIKFRKKRKEHDEIELEMTPCAKKFDFNIQSTIIKSRIDERYHELKSLIKDNEPTEFQNLDELEECYYLLLEKAKIRDRLMAELSGRRIEFYD